MERQSAPSAGPAAPEGGQRRRAIYAALAEACAACRITCETGGHISHMTEAVLAALDAEIAEQAVPVDEYAAHWREQDPGTWHTIWGYPAPEYARAHLLTIAGASVRRILRRPVGESELLEDLDWVPEAA